MTTTDPTLSTGPNGAVGVVAAVVAVMAALPNIGKDDRSPEGYQYRGIEAITRHTQSLFAEHGLLTVPHAKVLDVKPSPAMKDGWQDVHMEVTWTIAHTDGSTLTAVTNGVGRDRSDKGANKAQTQAYKYLLLHLLCIADGKDDSDGQTYEHDRVTEPDYEPAATPEQVADFNANKDALDDVGRALLKTWFADNQVPPIAKAPRDMAAAAIEEARRLLEERPF